MTPLVPSLTCREEAVLTMLGDGLGLREIAERLGRKCYAECLPASG